MQDKKTLQVTGAVTLWSLSAYTAYGPIAQAWSDLGLERLVPRRSTLTDAVSWALRSSFSEQRFLVRALPGGWSVQEEQVIDGGLEYREVCRVKLDARTTVETDYFTLGSGADESTIERVVKTVTLATRALGSVPRKHVTAALVSLVRSCGGIPLRDRGGVYYMPEWGMEKWEKAAAAVEKAAMTGSNSIYLLRVKKDADGARAIIAALTSEVYSEISTMRQEIEAKGLSGSALTRRQSKARRVLSKVENYEELLGSEMDLLRAACAEVEPDAAAEALTELGSLFGDL